jgi:hypothetical protein
MRTDACFGADGTIVFAIISGSDCGAGFAACAPETAVESRQCHARWLHLHLGHQLTDTSALCPQILRNFAGARIATIWRDIRYILV